MSTFRARASAMGSASPSHPAMTPEAPALGYCHMKASAVADESNPEMSEMISIRPVPIWRSTTGPKLKMLSPFIRMCSGVTCSKLDVSTRHHSPAAIAGP